jgi:ankyrin repeat protein
MQMKNTPILIFAAFIIVGIGAVMLFSGFFKAIPGMSTSSQGQITKEQTALLAAINQSDTKSIDALLQSGVSVDERVPVKYEFRPGTIITKQMTGLMLASEKGDEPLVRFFLDKGAGVNLDDMDRRFTPLLYAIESGNSAIVSLLLAKKADPDARMLNAAGRFASAALHLAVLNKKLDMVKAIVEAGAHLNIQDYDKLTPLDRAKAGLNPEIAQYLEEHGAKTALDLLQD